MNKFIKIIYYKIKSAYSKSLLIIYAVLLLYFIALPTLLGTGSKSPNASIESLFTIIASMWISMYALLMGLARYTGTTARIPTITRSDIDFVFSTNIEPSTYLFIVALADAIQYFIILIAVSSYTVIVSVKSLASYLATVIGLSLFLSLLDVLPNSKMGLYLVGAFSAYLITTAVLYPSANVIYSSGNPVYAAATILAAGALAYAVKRQAGEVASNAYGVLAMPAILGPRRRLEGAVVRPSGMPKSLWQLAWRTSSMSMMTRINMPGGGVYVVRRTNVLRILLPLSTAAAVAYLAISYLFRQDTAVIASAATVPAFASLLFLLIFSGISLLSERLWISFAADHYAYIKYRMFARAALAAISLAPLAVAFAASYPVYPPAIYLVSAYICAVLTAPQTSWIFRAIAHLPQVRDLNMPVAQPRLGLRHLLVAFIDMVILGIYMTPYSLALAAYSTHLQLLESIAFWFSAAEVAASAAFFYITLFSKAGRELWDSFVNRLSELGYV